MGKDLLSCKMNGQTFFSTENEIIKILFVNSLMNMDCTITDVTTQNKEGETRKAKKFVLNDLEMIELSQLKMFLWLQAGSSVLIFNDK